MRRPLALLSFWFLVAAGCSRGLPLPLGDAPAASASAAPLGPPVLLENDYPRAREEALRRGVPLVVFAGSPWCTDCLGMRAHVFPDEALSCIGTRFVWLALDVDDPANAPFWDRFPIERTPSLWVLEPARQRPVAFREGPLVTHELQALLEDVEPLGRPLPSPIPLASSSDAPLPSRPPIVCPGAAASASASSAPSASAPPSASSASASASAPPPPPPPLPPEQAAELRASRRLAEAEQAELSGSLAAAERAFSESLQSPRRWPRRARAVDGLQRLLARRNVQRCHDLAVQELPAMAPGTFAASVARRGLQCARRMEPDGSSTVQQSVASLEAITRNPSQPLLPSYRSNLYEDLFRFHRQNKDEERAQRLLREWVGFLETEAILARSPAQRRVFDDHRIRAYQELGTPAVALPAVELSAQDFPDDPASHGRLARGLADLGRHPEALDRVDRALPGARGQGLLRLVLLKAEILVALRRRDEARSLLSSTIASTERTPFPVEHGRLLSELRARLASLQGPSR